MLIVASCFCASAGAQRQDALRVFEEAVAAYEAADYDRAATLFAAAYELHGEPVLLFNQARALERAGDAEDAIEAYERYVALGDEVPDHEEARTRLANLRADRQAQTEPEAPLAPWWQRADPDVEEPEDDPDRPSYVGPAATVAAGAALALAGTLSGAAARRDHDLASDPRTTHEDAVPLAAQASRRQRAANALLVLGGVAAAGGVGWVVLVSKERKRRARRTEVVVAGTGLLVRGRF